MLRNHRRRAVALVAALAGGGLLAMPAVSPAALPSASVSEVTWNVRESWVDYLTNPVWYLGFGQGSVTATGGASVAAGSGTTSWGGSYTEYAYSYELSASDDYPASPRDVALTGGLDFDMSAHSIDVSLSDLHVEQDGRGNETLVADASYKPLGGSTVSRSDIAIAEIVGVDDTVQLTAAGAAVFNGGDNGSYDAGDPFGDLDY